MGRVVSAGLLAFRRKPLLVFLVRPGGPFFKRRDKGLWGIPKGRIDGQDVLVAARREFEEEVGVNPEEVRCSDYLPLGSIRYKSGKEVHAFAFESRPFHFVRSNPFLIEYPPGSGRLREFPEVEEGRWFTLDAAREYMLEAQKPFLDRLEAWLKEHPESACPDEAGREDA